MRTDFNQPSGLAGAARSSRIAEFDALRFVAAVAVMVYHLARLPGSFPEAVSYGFMGVPLFFMISGFVILWTASNKTLGGFFISRVSRLYPSFWVCVLLTTFVLLLASEQVPWQRLLANLTMVPRPLGERYIDGVYWTLYLELEFYALVGALMLVRQLDHIERWLYGWLGVVALSLVVPFGPIETLALRGYAAFFASGCLLYLMHRDGATASRLAAFAVSGTLSAVVAVRVHEGFTHLEVTRADVTVVLLVVAMHAVFLAIALRRLRLPDSPLWYWLGALTYPLYLLHNEIGRYLHDVLPFATWTSVWIAMATVIAIAVVLAATVERHGCRACSRSLARLAGRWSWGTGVRAPRGRQAFKASGARGPATR